MRIVSLCGVLLLPACALAFDPPSLADAEFFEAKVRPLLIARCQECHVGEKAKSGLRLDSREALLKGGDSGPAVVVAKPAESLLVDVLSYRGHIQMPPKAKLPDAEIAVLTEWVRRGLPWPNSTPSAPTPSTDKPAVPRFTDEQLAHWAFQPVRRVEPPAVKGLAWVRSPIDRFILAELEAKSLSPAREADRRTMLRRVTFDLVGLPPTLEEVADFLVDPAPDALERVVDRLLASPRYGERWARHWLDVARYADSNGLDENLAYANAYRYRDYVVKAFREDKPYDQFLVEQIAGDLLGEEKKKEPLTLALSPQGRGEGTGDAAIAVSALFLNPQPSHVNPSQPSTLNPFDALTATGFLTLGAKMLAEDDPVKMQMDIIDEQVDTLSRAVMGLTMGCARCHDHKFDPLTAEDYYGLAGIFKSTQTMDNFSVVARWHERPLATPDEIQTRDEAQQRVASHKQAVEKVKADATAAVLSEARLATALADPKDPLAKPADIETRFSPEVVAKLKSGREELTRLEQAVPKFPEVMAVAEAKPENLKIHWRGSHLTLGREVPHQLPRILTGNVSRPLTDGSGRLQLAQWLASPSHPLTARVMVNRVWQWHFGHGLVRSVDNFGRLGERPSHPVLLDWLAAEFGGGTEGGTPSSWSIKHLHRQLAASATYRMSTAHEANATLIDPENRLLWRFHRQRLEIEPLRDALLFVSGQLDETPGGTMLPTANRAYVTSTANVNPAIYNSNRRSIYLPVVRSALYEVFTAFDFADPSTLNGQRDQTTVAPQALFMMNSEFMLAQCRALTERLLARSHFDTADRLRELYELAYSRPATEAEVSRATAYLDRLRATMSQSGVSAAEVEAKAWTSLCRAVLAANEFVYVE